MTWVVKQCGDPDTIWGPFTRQIDADGWAKRCKGPAVAMELHSPLYKTSEVDQLKEDDKLLTRINDFGKGLTGPEQDMMDSFLKRVQGEKRPLTDKQREVAHNIDERRVG